MKPFIIIWLLCVLNMLAHAQQTGNPSKTGIEITGNILYKHDRQPVAISAVALLNAPDSSFLAATLTDENGRFIFDKVPPGNYLLSYSFNNEHRYAAISINAQQKEYNAGNLFLNNKALELKDVVVTGRKSLVNAGIDRKVYIVDKDIMSQSGSASDILKNVPSVDVSIDGQVSLRGSGEVLILINGKVSPLMGKTRAEVLQQLPANSIERIEVMTNPSARYRPDGTAGIINIVLKKNVKQGLNGSVIANVGNRGRYNSSAMLNYNPGKVNFSANYGFRRDYRYRNSDIDRVYFDSSGAALYSYKEGNTSRAMPVSHIAGLGAEWQMNTKTTIGVSANYFRQSFERNDISRRYSYDLQGALINNYDRVRYDPEHENQINVVTAFHREFGDEHDLNIEWNTSKANEKENNHYTNDKHFPVAYQQYDNVFISVKEDENQFTLDYTRPVGEEGILEMGYDGLIQQIEQDFHGEFFSSSDNAFLNDTVKSNAFNYIGNIQALYATYEKSYNNFGYNAGIRTEWTWINGYQVTKNIRNSNNYFNFYPTLHLSYTLHENHEIQLNYSKRVNRPDGDELNPFPEYQDPINLHTGNPQLTPEIIHSVELGYRLVGEKCSFVPGVYYRYKKNGFTSVTTPFNDTVLLTRVENLANDQAAGVELILTGEFFKNLNVNTSANFFYNRIDAANLGYTQKKGVYSMYANIVASYSFPFAAMLQVSCNYRSARLTPQGKSFPTVVMNTGLRKDFLKNRMSLVVTISDLLKTLRQKSQLTDVFLTQVTVSRRDARVLYVGVNYRFGVKNKAKEEKLQFDNNL